MSEEEYRLNLNQLSVSLELFRKLSLEIMLRINTWTVPWEPSATTKSTSLTTWTWAPRIRTSTSSRTGLEIWGTRETWAPSSDHFWFYLLKITFKSSPSRTTDIGNCHSLYSLIYNLNLYITFFISIKWRMVKTLKRSKERKGCSAPKRKTN